jgi:hypothetical protein
VQQTTCTDCNDLLDQLVGGGGQSERHVEAKRLGSLEVDDQLEIRHLLDRQVARFFALKNPANVDANQAIPIRDADIIAHQATGHGGLAPCENGGKRVAGGQCEDLFLSEVSGTTPCPTRRR